MRKGRRIYFDVATGKVLVDTGEEKGDFKEMTVEQDIEKYKRLSERNRESFDYIELEYGEHRQDFDSMKDFRVNPETKELEFSYPDPNQPEVEQPYQAPLSEQIEKIKEENKLLKAQNNATSERADFIEDVLAEMAIQVYQ